MAEPHSHTPFELSARDADFERAMLLWSAQTHSEIQQLIAATQETIATSRALLAEADRILGGQIGHLG